MGRHDANGQPDYRGAHGFVSTLMAGALLTTLILSRVSPVIKSGGTAGEKAALLSPPKTHNAKSWQSWQDEVL